jgi:hypothetical protein
MAYEGLAPDESDMQRLMFAHQAEDTVDELVSTEIGNLGQRNVATQMVSTVSVTAGTA